MKRINGAYAHKPAAEIKALIEAYKLDEELPDEKDPWEQDTAVESPKALSETRGPPKRSGEFLIELEREFQNRLDDERRIAAIKLGRRK